MRVLLPCLALALLAPSPARAILPPTQVAQVVGAAGGAQAFAGLTLSFTIAQPVAGSFTFGKGSLLAGFFIPGTVVLAVDDRPSAARSRLVSIGPNPCNGPTVVTFEIGAGDDRSTRLDILDVQGRRMRTLAHGALAPGPHRIDWLGDDDEGRALPVGIYMARLETASANSTLRLVRLH
jgi:hypothetical protein